MDADALPSRAAVLGWDGDVDRAVEGAQKAPMDGGGAVTQRGISATCEHGRHPPRLFADALMADRIDATMEAV